MTLYERTSDDIHYEANLALHKLWTAAVGTVGYDKALWLKLDQALSTLKRLASNLGR